MDNQLIESARRTADRVVGIITKKNGDYASAADIYANFKASSVIHIGVESSILVRTLDKIVRIGNLIEHDPYVTEESMDDSIDDVIGYMMILRAWREDQRAKNVTP